MVLVMIVRLLGMIVMALCDYLFQTVVTIYRYLSPDAYAFDKFIIEKVISVFHWQRQERDQFAVLIFTEENNLSKMEYTRFKPCDPCAWCNTPLVNNNYPYFPRGDLGNYLVARPDEGRHCEKIIFHQIHLLQDAYRRVHPRGPRCIILYSWLLPCSGCTREILRYYSNISAPRPKMVVAYTVLWCEVADTENQRNIEQMQQARIIVKKITYPHRLPPA